MNRVQLGRICNREIGVNNSLMKPLSYNSLKISIDCHHLYKLYYTSKFFTSHWCWMIPKQYIKYWNIHCRYMLWLNKQIIYLYLLLCYAMYSIIYFIFTNWIYWYIQQQSCSMYMHHCTNCAGLWAEWVGAWSLHRQGSGDYRPPRAISTEDISCSVTKSQWAWTGGQVDLPTSFCYSDTF